MGIALKRIFQLNNFIKMMRKSKFVNPSQKRAQSSFEQRSPNKSDSNNQLIQNKIYFPASNQNKLMSYKFQWSSQMKSKTDQIHSRQLYAIKEDCKSKDGKDRKSNFRRQNKFQKIHAEQRVQDYHTQSKSFIKYNTLELKKLPGISCTASGTTIYRSKNIKSLGKFGLETSPRKRGKSQFRRKLSVRNQESIESSILKSKSNKQTTFKSKDKKTILYQTYFSSRPELHQRSNSHRPVESFCEDQKQQFVEAPEDLLCKSLIQNELYGRFDCEKQQQFF